MEVFWSGGGVRQATLFFLGILLDFFVVASSSIVIIGITSLLPGSLLPVDILLDHVLLRNDKTHLT